MEGSHIAFMRRALSLAVRAKGRTSPNPMVGAVVVRNGEIVGEGYHRKAGTAHAEVHALEDAGERAREATLYTNLEPCCHSGRTPPCTEVLIRAGVAHVYIAEVDPNPKVSGEGIRQLKAAGIRVHLGICAAEAAALNEVHRKYTRTGLPFVTLKFAMSLDGKIATVSGESRWITSAASRQRVHEIRDEVDAIVVGRGTVDRDDPALTTRLQDRLGQDAVRIVLDSRGRTSPTAQIFSVESTAGVIVAVTSEAPPENIEDFRKMGADVLTVAALHGKVCFKHLMEILGSRELTSVLIEGGSEVNASAVAACIVDKVACFVAPKFIGGRNAPGPIGGDGILRLTDVHQLQRIHITQIPDSPDILIEGYL